MLLGGLWHGAGWTFVIWGGLHGICLMVNHLWYNFKKTLGRELEHSTWWGEWFARLFTLLLLSCLWVIFRAENMEVALIILKSMSGINGSLDALPTGIQHNSDRLLACLFLVWFAPNTQQFMSRFVPGSYNVDRISNFSRLWLQWAPNGYWAAFVAMLAIISLLNLTRINEFLYFQF